MQRIHLPLSLLLWLTLSAWSLPSSAATETLPSSSLPGRESLPPAAMTEADTALLDKIQRKTFGYFWYFAHPNSGLARERSRSKDVVTSGGSGFGVMAILVATERGWITRTAAIDRLQKMVGFLETADRFHGAWPHWLDGRSGKVIPFSKKDDGADLVETAMFTDLQCDLTDRVLGVVPVDWGDAHRIAEELSAKHTMGAGHRLADILHVPTALHLRAKQFLSFDSNQRALAKKEGLGLPV